MKFVKFLFVFGTFALMIYYQKQFLAFRNWEISLSFLIIMGILTFPISIGCLVFVPFLGILASALKIGDEYNIPVAWIVLVVLGFYQWFVVVPKLLVRSSKDRKNHEKDGVEE